jgi:hypothetical protein
VNILGWNQKKLIAASWVGKCKQKQININGAKVLFQKITTFCDVNWVDFTTPLRTLHKSRKWSRSKNVKCCENNHIK